MHTTDNHVGFPVAVDSNGNSINASIAQKGQIYYCPFCHCEMFPKTSHLGTDFFAKRKGAEHKHTICTAIERTGKYHSFAASESPTSLIATFCHTPVSRPKKKGIQIDDVGNKTEKHTNSILPLVSSFVPFKSLAQIYEYGKFQSSPFEKCGDYVISDYYIHYKWAKQFFADPNFVLGARIVHARFSSYNLKEQVMRFCTFKKNEFEIFFDVYFKRRDLFNSTLKKVCIPFFDPETQRTMYKKLDVLIAATDWHSFENNNYYAVIYSSKQIYPISTEK